LRHHKGLVSIKISHVLTANLKVTVVTFL